METEYIKLRDQYLPAKPAVVFVLESPPAGHGYFYDPNGKVSEVLFRSFMKLLAIKPISKDEGLSEFKRKGWVLVDPIYQPVNKLSDKEANKLILDNYPNFKKDLLVVIQDDKTTPIILIKANICRLLEEPLFEDGFNVVNDSVIIPFPLHYHLNAFLEKVGKLLVGL
jgi:hypothetical protein